MAKKKPKTRKTTKKTSKLSLSLNRQQKVVLGSFLMLFGLGLIVAFISFLFNWQADQSVLQELGNRDVEARNWLSKFGASVSDFFVYKGFGLASFSIAFLILLSGIYLFLGFKISNLRKYWFWGILVMVWISIVLGYFAEKNALLGGRIGYETNDFLQDYLGFFGSILLMLFLLIAYLAIRLKITPELVGSYLNTGKQELQTAMQKHQANVSETDEELEWKKEVVIPKDEEKPAEVDLSSKPEKKPEKKPSPEAIPKMEVKTPVEEDNVAMEVEAAPEEEEEDNLSQKLVKDFGEFDPTLELKNYKFPTIELLKDYGGTITINQEELEENKNRIVDTLKNYKIEIAQIKATVGPTVTLYEIVPEAGIRISKIKNLEDDIALSLSALGIRIIAPIPGSSSVGIELPNEKIARFVQQYGLAPADAGVLVAEPDRADFFESLAEGRDPKHAANWVVGELLGKLNKTGVELLSTKISAIQLGELIDLIHDDKISGRIAKQVFDEMFETGKDAVRIVEERGLTQVSDEGELDQHIEKILNSNSDKVAEYKAGKEKLFGFFVGQVMKATNGKANPKLVNRLLRERLSN